MKRLIASAVSLVLSLSALAQGLSGGIKATVVNRAGRAPITGAEVTLIQGDGKVGTLKTSEDGRFEFGNLPDGHYTLIVTADDFTPAELNVTVERGFMRDLVFITMSAEKLVVEVDDSAFAEFDLQDSGYSDSPTILFGSKDVYSDITSFGFSSVRFKNRGYNSETQSVLFAGVPMNDAITGYSPFSLWSGLNEATRSKDSTMGMETSDYWYGGYNGVTNIMGVPSSVRPGLRASLLSNSALYRLRLMLNYASGQMDNGWSYAINGSVRIGGNDWVEGVYYRSFALYGGVEKVFSPEHRLALVAFATPGQRGAQNASTQEVYDLMHDNMYNSNWGYQNGKVRNSRVRRTFEPVVALKYDYTPSDEFSASATLLYRTGFNGYTALDWYDAMDPRPDYYRSLPSYSYMEDEDYNRTNDDKAGWAQEMWNSAYPGYANYQHLDWDRLYNVNYNNADGRSKYALEERRVDQNDINLAGSFKWKPMDILTIRGGVSAKVNKTENYKKMNDLLGGKYYLNIDSFAERDFASFEPRIQNDLEYYLANGSAEKIVQGGKYGYDYYANIRKAGMWFNQAVSKGGFDFSQTFSLGYETFWRDGLMRKGLFAGLDDSGNDFVVGGVNLTLRDAKGNVVTSKGESEHLAFLTWSFKTHVAYAWNASNKMALNLGMFSDAPTFNEAFISPRTRNTVVDGLTNRNVFSTDLSYMFGKSGYNLRATAFYTKIMDGSDVMSFYDDSQNSFTNFAMTGIDQRHMGIEIGARAPLPVSGLSVSGALSLGEYIYTSNPHMVQTVDNSAEIIRDDDVPYWKSHPVYKVLDYVAGVPVYDEDVDGYIVEKWQKHYVPSTPQLAAQLSVNYNINYWFFELNGQYFAHSYLDMNPLYRTSFACSGGDGIETPAEIEYMASQEEFDPQFLLNLSIGKSWFVRGNQIGFSFNASNLLNNRNVKTGGYEQTRLIKSSGKDRYYRFDPKYFYMQGMNYMLNIYFRF